RRLLESCSTRPGGFANRPRRPHRPPSASQIGAEPAGVLPADRGSLARTLYPTRLPWMPSRERPDRRRPPSDSTTRSSRRWTSNASRLPLEQSASLAETRGPHLSLPAVGLREVDNVRPATATTDGSHRSTPPLLRRLCQV